MLERNFLVPICSGNLGNRSLCGLKLGFLSENNNHEAEMLNNLDEFFGLNQVLVSLCTLHNSGLGISELIFCETEE